MFEAHFGGKVFQCPGCKAPLNWWKAVRFGIREHFMLTGAFQGIGANTVSMSIDLKAGEKKVVDLADLGIPTGGLILSMNYTPAGDVMAIEMHGNVLRHAAKRRQLVLLGVPIAEAAGEPGKVHVVVTWLSPEDESSLHLIDAARAYDESRFDAVVVPACIAVESALGPVLNAWVSGFCSADNAKRFLDEGATYSHQLNVLIPIAARMANVDPLADDIRGLLNRLRKARNDIAHRGRPEKPVDQDAAADFLAAAVFGYHYCAFLRASVEAAQRGGTLPKAI
jgi:hypothetical protein